MFKYNIYGLKILSDISISDIEENKFDGNEDIKVISEIYKGNLKIENNSKKFENNFFELIIKDIAIFQIYENQINIKYFKKTTNEEISLYLLGTCIGYLLYKNNYLPLHGSSIYTDKGAIFFIGDSGIGKSTILNLFLKKNYKMISDDVIGLKEINNDILVFPSFPRTKIWKDTADKLGIKTDNLNKIYNKLDKFSYPISKNLFFNSTTKPYIVYELVTYDKNDIFIEKIQNKFEIVKSLYSNTYRLSMMKSLSKNQLQFNIITKLANKISFRKIYRPLDYNNIQEFANLVEEDFLND